LQKKKNDYNQKNLFIILKNMHKNIAGLKITTTNENGKSTNDLWK